jgi:hypothetical protein
MVHAMWARPLSALLVACALVVCSTAATSDPQISFSRDVPAGFRDVATTAWTRFTTTFEARKDCLAPVSIEIAWALDDRAQYEPRTRVVVVRVPGTAPNLTASLVHEFAHHLEFTCADQRWLRPRFLRAAELPQDSAWFGSARYENVPSERFAEAVVAVVLGRSSGIGVSVAPGSVQVVRAWARG